MFSCPCPIVAAAAALLVAASGAPCAATAAAAVAGSKTKPSIIFVLTDDQDALLNGYDPAVGVNHMAQLNSRVRSKGALFTNYYLAYPLCSPSRAAILTGTFPHNHGLTDNGRLNTSTFHPVAEARTVNTWLQAGGYETMLCGKYMNGYHANNVNKAAQYVPPGWSSFFGFQTVAFFGTAVRDAPDGVHATSKVYPKDNYQTDIISNITLDWMRSTRNRSLPFFLFLTPHAPHSPYTPAPRHKGTLAGLTQPPDPSFNLPSGLQSRLPGNLGTLPLVDPEQMDAIYESRAEALLAIDEMIGHLLDEAEAQQVQDLYFFFSCDNGYHLGQHRMPPGKREIYQHDINVPLIVSGPGIAPGSTIPYMAQNVDLAITWAALAGVSPSAAAPPIDGKSLLPMLLGEGGPVRTYTLQEGYQSCEAGHGEGRACSRKGPRPPPGPPPPPPTPFACTAAAGQFCPHVGMDCATQGSPGARTVWAGPEPTLQECQQAFTQRAASDHAVNCLSWTPHPEGSGNTRCKVYKNVTKLTPDKKHTSYVPGGQSGHQVEAPARCAVDYSGLRLKNHSVPAINAAAGIDAMYVEYADGGKSYYDCGVDPWQTKDLYASLSSAQRQALHAMLSQVRNCTGPACP